MRCVKLLVVYIDTTKNGNAHFINIFELIEYTIIRNTMFFSCLKAYAICIKQFDKMIWGT